MRAVCLAAGEIALAMVLLVCGGSAAAQLFQAYVRSALGLRCQHIVKANISLPRFQYSNAAAMDGFLRRIAGANPALNPGLQDSARRRSHAASSDGSVNLGFDIVGSSSVVQSRLPERLIMLLSVRLFSRHGNSAPGRSLLQPARYAIRAAGFR